MSLTQIKKPIIVRGDDSGKLGLVHVITGDGKGKTTSSLGIALRAVGNNLRVYMIQFLKSGFTGELYSAKKLGFEIEQFGVDALKEILLFKAPLAGISMQFYTLLAYLAVLIVLVYVVRFFLKRRYIE